MTAVFHSTSKSRLVREEDEPDDEGEDGRISFTGVKSAAKDRKLRQEEMRENAYSSEDDARGNGKGAADDDEDEGPDWEEMQIRKAMNKTQISETMASMVAEQNATYLAGPGTGLYSQEADSATTTAAAKSWEMLAKPAEYNLQGIKDRLKKR